MIFINGNSNKSYLNFIFALMDGVLILGGIIIGEILRFGWKGSDLSQVDFGIAKILVMVGLTQIVYYYFDLYELKSLKDKTKIGILLLEALGITSILLAVLYFVFPVLRVWRGAFILMIITIFVLTLLWRVLYPWLIDRNLFKEKVLIIGTGEIAYRISVEIGENGQDAFEIVGFVDEDRERIGEKIGSENYRGFQPDLFHLQRRQN